MSLLRLTATRSSNALFARPATMSLARGYAAGPGGSDAGATATSTSFKDREQGQEKEYILRAEQEKLKKLRETLAKQREHMNEVEAALNDLSGQDGKAKK